MTTIEFTKLQGLGNDFLIMEVDDVRNLPDAGEIAIKLCERNYGAGADGIVYISHTAQVEAEFASRIFNADGSEAEVSGNGTRCAAAYIYHRGLWSEPEIGIATQAGVKLGRPVSREGALFEFEFDMGEPKFSSSDLQMALPRPLERVVGYCLNIGDETVEVTCVSMGNPHCAIFLPTLDGVNLAETGPLIEGHPVFPNHTNVEFAHAISREEIEVMFWERGVGRTNSSGTGSCGSAVAAMLNGLTDRNIRVRTAGGLLRVNWREDNRVMLTGTAEVLYEGRWLKD